MYFVCSVDPLASLTETWPRFHKEFPGRHTSNPLSAFSHFNFNLLPIQS
jgi:hypothetical protein